MTVNGEASNHSTGVINLNPLKKSASFTISVDKVLSEDDVPSINSSTKFNLFKLLGMNSYNCLQIKITS